MKIRSSGLFGTREYESDPKVGFYHSTTSVPIGKSMMNLIENILISNSNETEKQIKKLDLDQITLLENKIDKIKKIIETEKVKFNHRD